MMMVNGKSSQVPTTATTNNNKYSGASNEPTTSASGDGGSLLGEIFAELDELFDINYFDPPTSDSSAAPLLLYNAQGLGYFIYFSFFFPTLLYLLLFGFSFYSPKF